MKVTDRYWMQWGYLQLSLIWINEFLTFFLIELIMWAPVTSIQSIIHDIYRTKEWDKWASLYFSLLYTSLSKIYVSASEREGLPLLNVCKIFANAMFCDIAINILKTDLLLNPFYFDRLSYTYW